MRRRLFAILSAFSLLACVAIVALWVRSFWATDGVVYDWSRSGYGLMNNQTSCGVIYITHWYSSPTRYRPQPHLGFFWVSEPPRWRFQLPPHWHVYRVYGDICLAYGPGISEDIVLVPLPHWLLFLLSSLLPVFWFRSARRRRRERVGTCKNCGYDLRASTSKCPECGMQVP